MSLRARLLAAFAYVLVLVIVALEVPLALNLSRRVDAEIKSEAQSQAALLAATLSGRLGDREELAEVLEQAASDLGGRVIVVGPRGRLLADSAGPGLASTSYASRPPLRNMSSVSCVRMADSRVVCALSCDRRSWVCEERSASEAEVPLAARPLSDSDGRVSLR